MGFDIETAKVPAFADKPSAGLDPHLSKIRLAQFCKDTSEAYVFDVWAVGLEVIMPLFDMSLVAHNAVFEIKHLHHAGIEPMEMHCNMLMHNALYGDRISLKNLAKKILNVDLSKEEQVSDWGAETLSEDQIKYAAMDAVMALRIGRVLNMRMMGQPCKRLYSVLWQAQYAVAKMEYNGCNFDVAGHYSLKNEWKSSLEKATISLQAIVGGEVNLSSPKQISDWLETKLTQEDLDAWPKTISGPLQITEDALNGFGHLDFIIPLLEYKKYTKLNSTYGDKLLNHVSPVTGRIHPSFSIAGAITGRFTCSKPNTQQMPREDGFRRLFNAPKGRKIIVADYSQVELRVLAMITQDPTMLKAYEQGKDLHKLTASKTSGVPFEDVTKEQRQGAKAVNFGLVFGMGAKGLSQYARATYGVSMSVKNAEKAKKAYFKTYPQIAQWHKQTYTRSKRLRLAETPLGRKVDLRKKPDKIYTRSKNIPVQGGAAEIMLAALISLDNKLIGFGMDAKIVNIVHDEIVLEVVEDQAEKVKEILEESMVEGMLFVFPEAVTSGLVEAAIGNNWTEAK